ncbi:TonB-dependent receptor [Salinisphaera sp. Q1T1-3]|uniref:TonB-dependent receptor n=1 Tax=Salinisphaera sp. Q1T1-3 TaxID=2321229 RepID=UPI000E70DAE2|nr:TonB-dependent receptor [Salinisphaera sp. Q1T1-3]RJS94754.1 TonB-dependent receptor [Salinisphaera sp. Q1T1-3]
MALAQDDTTSDEGYVAPADASRDDAPIAAAPAEPAAAAAPAAATAAPATAAAASTSGGTTELDQVTVTGSAIPRADAATALPVTTYSADELRQQGVTSVAGIMQQVAANSTASGPGAGYGLSINGGASYADLRGLGPNSTLILVNGRRLANNAFNGGAVSLESIPFAAIERVEVLRDGASAIYGTDAVGGVVNYITKKNFDGGDFGLTYTQPTRSGGGTDRLLEATFGKGNLNKDGWNVMGSLSYHKQEPISAGSRQGIINPYQPDVGIDSTGLFTVPSNYYQNVLDDDGTTIGRTWGNRDYAAGCPGQYQIPYPGETYCASNTTPFYQIQQDTDDLGFFGNASYKITNNHLLSASYIYSHSVVYSQINPYGITGLLQPGTPFYPSDNPNIDPTRPVRVAYLNASTGPRETRNLNTANRVVLNLKGHFGKTHYDTALTFNQQTTALSYTRGYLNDQALDAGDPDDNTYGSSRFSDAMNSGLIDPFAREPSPAGQQYLNDFIASGQAEKDRGRVYMWDGKVNRTVGNWFGAGPVAFALGSQVRHEELAVESGPVKNEVAGGGLSPTSLSKDRTVEGVFAEVNVPLLDSLEFDAAARYDNYSDFGDTLNPKFSLRYQPFKQLVIRGSYSEGYQAPTLYNLYNPEQITYTQDGLNDPQLCPGGQPAPGALERDVCSTQFERHYGGNEDLKPATSEQYNFGVVIQPIEQILAEVTYWHIVLDKQASLLPVEYLFDNYGQYPGNITRYGPDSDQAGQIDYITTPTSNLGTTRTDGLDTRLQATLKTAAYGTFGVRFEGTYVLHHKYQNVPGGEFQDDAGVFVDSGPTIQWKHNITASWRRNGFRAELINHYVGGYKDQYPDDHKDVDAFITFDADVGYDFNNGVSLTLGSKNFMDADPPLSNQTDQGIPGYDPRYADAIGRTVYGKLEYRF